MKKVLGRYGNDRGHWVGDGFPVPSLFSYNSLGEPIDGYGPFVMNSEAEIRQAIEDFNRGRFGAIATA